MDINSNKNPLEKEVYSMAVLARPCNSIITIKSEKTKQFLTDSKKNTISQERLTQCLQYSKMLKHKGWFFTDNLKETALLNLKPACRLNDDTKSYLNGFYCGTDEIDRYVKEDAYTDIFIGNGVTYLVIDDELNHLVAYYTLSTTAIRSSTDDLQGIPSIEIKMFAVNNEFQDTLFEVDGRKTLISDFILGSLIGDLYTLSQEVLGFKFIVLHSVENAKGFYERNGFCEIEDHIMFKSDYEVDDCIPMYMRLYVED